MSETVGFPCPNCDHRMDVKDSRATHYHNRASIRRRRRCRKCGWALTTYEVMDNAVLKADARLGPVMHSLRRAHEAMGALLETFDVESDGDTAAGNGAAERNASSGPTQS